MLTRSFWYSSTTKLTRIILNYLPTWVFCAPNCAYVLQSILIAIREPKQMNVKVTIITLHNLARVLFNYNYLSVAHAALTERLDCSNFPDFILLSFFAAKSTTWSFNREVLNLKFVWRWIANTPTAVSLKWSVTYSRQILRCRDLLRWPHATDHSRRSWTRTASADRDKVVELMMSAPSSSHSKLLLHCGGELVLIRKIS